MRIILTHNYFGVRGGAEVFLHEVSRLLSANGHDVAILCCSEPEIDYPYQQYFPKAVDHENISGWQKVLSISDAIYNKDAALAMRKLIRDFRPDIVHAFSVYHLLTPSVLAAAHDSDIPVVLSCNDYKHICPNYKMFHHGGTCDDCKDGKFFNVLKNRCRHDSLPLSAFAMIEGYVHKYIDVWKKNVDCFLFASEFMARKTEEFWGATGWRYEMFRNPFDIDMHLVNGMVGDYFFYFGRLIDEKGVDILMRAAELVPDVKIVIAGEGPDCDQVSRKAARLHNVDFVGPKWGDDLKLLLKNCRAVVVPSVWHENFPYVIFQSFAARKTVIGSNRGGIPELVDADQRGWIYDADDPRALAATIQKVTQIPNDDLADRGARAQTYVKNQFSDELSYGKLMEIYTSVIDRHNANHAEQSNE